MHRQVSTVSRAGRPVFDSTSHPMPRPSSRAVSTLPSAPSTALPASSSALRDGICGTAQRASCLRASKGSWALSEANATSWRRALQTCGALCDGCRHCNYLSISLEWRDCSWFRACDLRSLDRNLDKDRNKVKGFRSLAWPRAEEAAAPGLRARAALLGVAQRADADEDRADGAPSSSSRDEPRDGREATCRPIEVERRKRTYGFSGFHWVAPLRVWLYEVPKSGSTTLMRMLKLAHGADDRRKRPPQPGDVAVALVRHPLCRALSGFREAYERAAFRTNGSRSACPFRSFPYLLEPNASTAQHRLGVALRTLARRGSALAGAQCGYAYHHMLSQAYFLWPERTWSGASMHLPPVTRLLRLESLEADLRALCAERGAAAHCERMLGRGVPHANEGNSFEPSGGSSGSPARATPRAARAAAEARAKVARDAAEAKAKAAEAFAGLEPRALSAELRAQLLDYYSTDFACLNYSRTDVPDCRG